MSEKQEIELIPKSQSALVPAPSAPSQEDSGSQALSEALQSSFFLVKILMVVLTGVFLCSGFFIVQPGQKAIVLRFGKPVGDKEKVLLGPGFHWAFPRPIDEVTKVALGQIQEARSTVGWYAITPEMEAAKIEPAVMSSLNPATEGYTLTADTNIIHARATLRYHITDPVRFLFDYVNAPEFVTNALNNGLLFASSKFTVDDALTRNRAGFRETVEKRVKELVAQQNLGISIEQLDVDAIPPRKLKEQFDAVLQASIKRDDALNKAKMYIVQTSSKASAEADSRINAARSETNRLVRLVAAEAKEFTDILPQYQANPDLYMQTRQVKTMGNVLAKAQEKMFVPHRTDGKPRELWLHLSREPQAPPPTPPEK